MKAYPKRLIEVDLPIKRVSAHARREKSIRHGHISTLHIWWARRPLAACRAVICAALWPDPADSLCPEAFREQAAQELRQLAYYFTNMPEGANELAADLKNDLRGSDTIKRKAAEKEALRRQKYWGDFTKTKDLSPLKLREGLLEFIAWASGWEQSTISTMLNTSRTLTQVAHESLGGILDTKPLVVDPFAGGGSIPLEALRMGADAFASDLNPVAVLLNKVVLEYLPKYGQRLANEVRKWGQWVKEQAEKELAEFYPKDPDGAIPIAYLWARTITCEGPGCGAQFPLIRQPILSRRPKGNTAILLQDAGEKVAVNCTLVEGAETEKAKSSCKGFKGTCPRSSCGYSTPKKSVQAQLSSQKGGADTSRLLAVLTDGPRGRTYRLPTEKDIIACKSAHSTLAIKVEQTKHNVCTLIPDEPIPPKTAHRAVGSQLPLYGFQSWGDLFTSRQKLALIILQDTVKKAYYKLENYEDELLAQVILMLLALAIDKQVDYSSSLCRWVPSGEFIAATLGGEKKLPMLSDFAEGNPVGCGSGSWINQVDWIARFLEKEASSSVIAGTVMQGSADEQLLPTNSVNAMITDPPYYDSVPYSDLSDFFYVWLRRTLSISKEILKDDLAPKDREMTVNHPKSMDEMKRYEGLLTKAFSTGRNVTVPSGIGVIVFAHKTTSGWEALLEAIVQSGWIVTGSWPIDTERGVRMNALDTASLASSVHIVCRPRENLDGSLRIDDIGDWRDVLQELPHRIHEWMPRLASEGVVGADAIFACLGPALEIFSRYSRVEKASGEQVTLKDYLEYVWAAVSKEALSMIFTDADATDFEEDARLTAMWMWTLSAGTTDSTSDSSEPQSEADDDEETSSKPTKISGYVLEFDAARKIAQGLGAYLENLRTLIEVKGDKARLLPVSERAPYLFGKDQGKAPTKRKKKEVQQLTLFTLPGSDEEESTDWGETSVEKLGNTVLDRIHQSMILFAAGRSEALKRFLVEDGVGADQRFWKLAQALSALYPNGTDEKRWVDGVLARKKGLGF